MKNNVLVFLYKRELLENDNDTINNDVDKLNSIDEETKDYVLSPIKIIEGRIEDVNGVQIFHSKDNKLELKKIDNVDAIDDEFVFAFPMDVDGYNKNDKIETIKYIETEELFNVYLLQGYNKNINKKLKTYAHNINSEKVLVLINPDNYDESQSVLIYDTTELAKQLKEKQILLLKYEDTVMLEEQKKEIEEEKAKYEGMPHKAVKYGNDNVYADELYDEIRKSVISQDEQIKAISTIFAKNQKINNPYMKSNFILCGPTGVGKSEIFRQLSKIANVPMITEDATEFTAAGFVGRSVTDILLNLYNAAERNIVKAENGIVLIDEIDKKAGGAGELEVTKGAVIQALLKMIEGHTYALEYNKKTIYFDTSRVTFAFCGAFSGIEKYAQKKNNIGFASNDTKDVNINDIYNTETLKKYGLLPEFIGRNRIIAMKDLKQSDFVKILNDSYLSYLRLYREMLKELNIEFKYEQSVVEAIAKKAIELKIGARSLKSIVEKAVEEADFYINSRNGSQYKELIITPETIEDNKKFILR